MRYIFYYVLLSSMSLSNAISAELIVPLLSTEGKVYVAAEIETIDASDSRMISAIQTGENFLQMIKQKGVEAGYSSFTNEDGSQSKVKNAQSPLNFQKLKERVSSIEYGDSAIAWGDYLLVDVKYQLKNRAIDFREDYFCVNNKCLKSIKEYGQLMENVYSIRTNYPENTYQGNLTDEVFNTNDSLQILTAINPDSAFNFLKEDSVYSFQIGVSILGLGEWQCIQCGVLGADEDKNWLVNSTIREVAQQIRESNGSSGTGKLTVALKQHSTSISDGQTIPIVSWNSSGSKVVHVDSSDYLIEFENALKGSIVGHIPDRDYVYLITSNANIFTDNEPLQFQVFIMKSQLDSIGENIYLFDPEPADKLDSQYLVFDSDFLSIVASIIKSKL